MELLSPAGSYEALIAAVQSGADAVYLGGTKFGARSSAKNFTADEMEKWINYCHLYGVKVYITVNTLIKESEIPELADYIRMLSDINSDGVIVQDFAVLNIVKQAAPELPVHGSTQMTATSLDDVEFLYNLGFTRVVLSRELSYNEIKYICDNTDCEIEVFVHGALCMCYSGQCLFSSIIGGRSGNRGNCAQPCRLPYTIVGDNSEYSGYVLSPKDLCLVEKLDLLKRSGAVSLKIEGRLKRAEYVAAVTGVYRKYLDTPGKVSEFDLTQLKNAFGRGFTSGKFGGADGKKMMSMENPSNVSGNIFTDEVKQRSREDANVRKIPVDIYANLKLGEVLTVTISDGEHTVTAKGTIPAEKAIKMPTDSKRLSDNLIKLGNTCYVPKNVEALVDGLSVIPVSEINAVRRLAAEQLSKKRISRKKRVTNSFEHKRKRKAKLPLYITCSVCDIKQAEAAARCGIEVIYAPENVACRINSDSIIVKCPELTKNDNTKGEKVCISNAGQIKRHSGSRLFGSSRLNITNSLSAEFYGNYLESIILSPELRIEEITDICSSTETPCGVTAYGRLDLMLCENCPLKASGKCQNHENVYSLKDRKNECFPLVCTDNCQMRILNSKPIYMADKIKDLTHAGISFINLEFTLEGEEECTEIIRTYQRALSAGNARPMPDNTFTRGHFYRGIK